MAVGNRSATLERVTPGVVLLRDTCNVYALATDGGVVCVDFGSGSVLDRLDELGGGPLTDVLVTHHHRDQVQGLARAVAAGARIWVPPVERELVDAIDAHWGDRPFDNDYDLRQDRYSLLDQVAVTGTVDEYRTRPYGGLDVLTLPTPGHTVGSVSYVVEREGRRLVFSGDLLYAPGKLWSLAATQWTYSGTEGQAATILSLGRLRELDADLLLPSHGDPIAEPRPALELTRARLDELMTLRRETPWDLDGWARQPWRELSPHLLWNRTSFAYSYALLSDDGAALLVDWGYDQCTGVPLGADRSTRRPLLASLEALRRDYGVDRIEAVAVTHFHDDHVAGINLLRDVEGTEPWIPENVAPVLADPHRYDLPCLWYDPIPAGRVLRLREPVAWHEYELTAYPLPGHTLHAAAIGFEVDGRRVLATGDQQTDGARPILNYQYRNRFAVDDFVRSAELYVELRPDLIVSGHWQPLEVTPELLAQLHADGRRLAELHRELLPFEQVDLGAEGFGARIEPYRSLGVTGEELRLSVGARNPYGRDAAVTVRLDVPAGWHVEPAEVELRLGPLAEESAVFAVRPSAPARRARVAADITVEDVHFGQQAEALVDVS